MKTLALTNMIVFYLIIFAITVTFLYFKHIFSHWKRKRFPYIQATFPFGNLAPAAMRKCSFGLNIYELYKSSTDRIVGVYLFFQPALLIRDAKIARKILVGDFDSFHDRGVYHNSNDPFTENIFALPGEKWKTLRQKLTPTFTTGKMKGMLPSIMTIGENLQNYLKPMADQEEVVEINDILTRYAMDVIATTIFGLDTNVLDNPDDLFRAIDQKINNQSFMSRLRGTSTFLCPKIFEILKMKFVPSEVEDYMSEIVKQNIDYREKHNFVRKDFIHCLIQLRNTGKINLDDDLWESERAADELKSLTIEQCAAQVLLFYLAGYDTSSAAVAYTLFELSRNPELMKRLQNEIDQALVRHSGVLTYECMNDIPLLELCIQESIRKYPTLPLLNRICTKDYAVPDTNLKIEKGTPIIISLLGIFRDPEYFPEPMKFMPERYTEEHKLYNPVAYFPFGDGPRACIGLRLGKIISKVALILLLQKYSFESLDRKELEFDTYAVGLRLKNGINVKVTNR